MSQINQDLFRGHVDTIVLKALSIEPKYGYEILSIISDASKDIYNIKQSTLYSILKRLEKNGLISSYLGDESMGGRRRYYALTESGKSYLAEEQADWEFSRTLLDVLVSDKQVDLELISPTYNPSDLSPLTKRNKSIDEENYYNNLNKQEETSNNTTNKESTVDEQQTKSFNDIKDEDSNNNHKKDISHALKTLQIGEYSLEEQKITIMPIYQQQSSEINNNFNVKKNLSANKPITLLENEEKKDRINYKDELAQLFFRKKEPKYETRKRFHEESLKLEEGTHRVQHFNDLRQNLLLEGYRLKPYNKFNTLNYYYMKYIYSNKLMRDTSYIVSVIFFIISLLITIFHPILEINSIIAPLIMTLIFAIYPIITTIIWNIYPTKRIKAKYNLTFTLIKTSIIILLTISITVITHIISGNIISEIKKFKFYIPMIYSMFFPIYALIYYLLFRTTKYHLSKNN